ncbi:hypothetical protein Pflav_028440 [Phytohabitans flavus]|uniref:Uncharacterized protein n=1 Tax=Phytohabitans flavus TaxID=1076124 RepID=A0A6F8XRH1_9ACTN|nr:hypothetical protein Pflav_028440 [Phytohabitans flavus]
MVGGAVRSSATPSAGTRTRYTPPLPERPEAEPLLGFADLGHHRGHRLLWRGHLHLAQERVGRAGLAGEGDAEQLAYRAAAAVAPDEVARAQPRTVGQLGGHPVAVLAQPHQLAAAPDLGTELGGMLGQQSVAGGLRHAEDVAVRGVQPLGRGLLDPGEETVERVPLAVREEPLQQTALVHHLDAAHVQAERADERGRLRLLLQHEHPHAVQPQLAGQHQSGRSPASDDHVKHETPLFGRLRRAIRRYFRRLRLRPTILRHDPGLAARPGVRYTLEVAGSAFPPFASQAREDAECGFGSALTACRRPTGSAGGTR